MCANTEYFVSLRTVLILKDSVNLRDCSVQITCISYPSVKLEENG